MPLQDMATPGLRAPSYGLLAACCALVLGCAASRAGSNNRYMVSSARCEFYKNGPAQAFGPDAVLPKGQKVTMVAREFGFSQIRLEDNTVGYVATDELTQLPPETPTPKPIAARRRSAPPVPERGLDLSDTPAPLPQ